MSDNEIQAPSASQPSNSGKEEVKVLYKPLNYLGKKEPTFLNYENWRNRENQSISLSDAVRAYIHADLDLILSCSRKENKTELEQLQEQYVKRRDEMKQWIKDNQANIASNSINLEEKIKFGHIVDLRSQAQEQPQKKLTIDERNRIQDIQNQQLAREQQTFHTTDEATSSEQETIEILTEALKKETSESVEIIPIVPIAPRTQTIQNNIPHLQNQNTLTIRRIIFAVLAVISAFVCIMIQTLPLGKTYYHNSFFDHWSNQIFFLNGVWNNQTKSKYYVDRLARDLCHIRDFETLHDTNTKDGVLHIPSFLALQKEHGTKGINETFVFKDKAKKTSFRGVYDDIFSISELKDMTLSTTQLLIMNESQSHAMHWNTSLLTTYFSPKVLNKLQSLLVQKEEERNNIKPIAFHIQFELPMHVKQLNGYNKRSNTENKKFTSSSSTSSISTNLLENQTLMKEWEEFITSQQMIYYEETPTKKTSKQTKASHYELPTLITTSSSSFLISFLSSIQSNMKYIMKLYYNFYSFAPVTKKLHKSKPCTITRDLDAHDQFHYFTSVTLSYAPNDGRMAGGNTLYIDDSNSWFSNKIKKGLLVDPGYGRVIVSTGDHYRCQLPVRVTNTGTIISSSKSNSNTNNADDLYQSLLNREHGIKLVLRIWWHKRCNALDQVCLV